VVNSQSQTNLIEKDQPPAAAGGSDTSCQTSGDIQL